MQRGYRAAAEAVGSDCRPDGSGYALVRRAIAYLGAHRGDLPDLDRLADHLGVSAAHVQREIARWCGLTPTVFAQTLTMTYVRDQLAGAATVLDGTAPGGDRIHDFKVTIAGTISDDARRRGAGLDIDYGFHASPFGDALVMTTGGAVCGLAFTDDDADDGRRATLDDMIARWPRARFREAPDETGSIAARIFGAPGGNTGEAVSLAFIGTAFDLRVWQALLRIPMGRLVSYADIARHLGRPSASRAVGTANGRNPISFVVPCHRALRGDGTLGGYYWGLTRKRALIAWEAGRRSSLKRG